LGRTAARYSNGYESSQALERLQGVRVGDLGVDLHRDVDLRMPQDAHRDSGMDVEGGEQGGAGPPGVMDLEETYFFYAPTLSASSRRSARGGSCMVSRSETS
jgi:hypothetical protein